MTWLIAATAAALVPAGAAAGAPTPWTAPQTLWSGGQGLPPRPAVAVGLNGATTIAWFQPGLGTERVRAGRRARPAAAFGAPLTLASARHPRLAAPVTASAAGDGAATVAWTNERRPTVGVVPVLGATAEIPAGGAATSLGIGVDRRGAAIAAWMEGSGTSPYLQPTLQVAERAAGAAAFGPPITLGPAGATQPTLAVSIDGRAVVAWIGEDHAVWAASREPATGWGPPVPVWRGVSPQGPTVAIGDLGDAVLAWYDNGAVAAARHRDGTWGAPERLEPSRPSPPSSRPAVSVGRLGTAIIAWRRGPAPLAVLSAWRGDATGPWRVRTVARTTRNLGEPAAVTSFSGDALVAWSRPTASGAQIQARRVPRGGPQGPLEQVSSGPGAHTAPALGIGPGGTVTAAWVQLRGGTDPGIATATRRQILP